MPRVLPIILAVAVWIYGIIHCAVTKSDYMPGRVPKWGWMALNIFLPVLGAIVWFVALYLVRSSEKENVPPAPLAPDDDPDFLAHLERENRLRQWERNRDSQTDNSDEEILKRLEDDFDDDDNQ